MVDGNREHAKRDLGSWIQKRYEGQPVLTACAKLYGVKHGTDGALPSADGHSSGFSTGNLIVYHLRVRVADAGTEIVPIKDPCSMTPSTWGPRTAAYDTLKALQVAADLDYANYESPIRLSDKHHMAVCIRHQTSSNS